MIELLEHQRAGAAWLAEHRKAQLGDEPGMGKTHTAIEGLKQTGSKRPLIVCPAIARTHWSRSLAAAGYAGDAEVASFERVAVDGMPGMAQRLLKDGIDSLIIDESQYCKTMTSARAKIILGNDGYARRLEHVFALSGSIPKHPGEMFNIVCSLQPELLIDRGLTTRERWMERFTVRVNRMVRGVMVEKIVGQQNVDELREILSHVLLKRSYGDAGLDVPELWFQTVDLDGASNQSLAGDGYEDVQRLLEKNTWDESLEEIANDPEIARMRRRIGELKAPLVVEMLKHQLRGTDEKIVVFAHHRSVLETLREGLKEFTPLYVDGDTLDVARNVAIDRFQNTSGWDSRVFIGQNIACRFSITLTAATRAVLVEPSWSADDNLQMGRRIARIGAVGDRRVAQLVSLAGTLDEAVVAQNAREVRMAHEVFQKEGSMK